MRDKISLRPKVYQSPSVSASRALFCTTYAQFVWWKGYWRERSSLDVGSREIAIGTWHAERPVVVLGQRQKDSWVEVKLVNDPKLEHLPGPLGCHRLDNGSEDVHSRPPRHRRSSGGSRVPVDWKAGATGALTSVRSFGKTSTS